ncbi:hypothetical protein [Paenarthrobacter sp. NPDC058040]|uniref:hypothetical protein n=1 Tax=unclassified Paenarthrobacter TaxID=2634190 RepID=UPI0036DB18E3
MSIIPKHRRGKSEHAARWLATARQFFRGATAEKNVSVSHTTMLPSGSLFSTLYAGSHLPVQRPSRSQWTR